MSMDQPTSISTSPVTPHDIVSFWREAGKPMWYAKDAGFDRRFREIFLGAHEAATRGELDGWLASPDGALALLILLDQFPRNAFRGTAWMYASDAKARDVADRAIAAGHDRQVCFELRNFFYLPFSHSEDLADQERAVSLISALDEESVRYAEGHRDIIRRFGRFPHRNAVLGRITTAAEQQFLDQGGFAG